MKLEKYFTIFLVVFIALAFLYLFARGSGGGMGITSEAVASDGLLNASTSSFDTKATGSLGSGDALVELTPTASNEKKLVVKFSINTHSVRLSSFDLRDVTTLEYDGKVLKPVKASRIGGHHSSGTIEFDTGKVIESFTIRIHGIPTVEERVYEWNAG